MLTAKQLLTLAEAYAAATNRTLVTVGRYACNNDKIFTGLKDGRGCNILTAELAGKWFAENWPDDSPWPAGVPRPAIDCRSAA